MVVAIPPTFTYKNFATLNFFHIFARQTKKVHFTLHTRTHTTRFCSVAFCVFRSVSAATSSSSSHLCIFGFLLLVRQAALSCRLAYMFSFRLVLFSHFVCSTCMYNTMYVFALPSVCAHIFLWLGVGYSTVDQLCILSMLWMCRYTCMCA